MSDQGVPRTSARVTVKGTIREGFNLGSLGDRINLPLGLLKFMGWSLMGLGLGLSVFGAAGLAGLMASRMKLASPGAPAEFGVFVRAAVMIELAAIFPLLGWLAFFPISLLISLGAALLTWLRGAPAPEKGARPELVQAGTGAQA